MNFDRNIRSAESGLRYGIVLGNEVEVDHFTDLQR